MKINLFALSTIAALSALGQASADVRNWDYGATTTNWDDAANWSSDTVPIAGDNANITGFSSAQSPVITDATSAISLGELQVGQSGTGFLSINGSNGSIGVGVTYVGMFTNSVGTVTQNSGTVTTTDLRVGFDNNSKGTYNLTGGLLTVTSNLALAAGNSAGNQGDFNQSGGTFVGAGAQIANFNSARVATMKLSDAAQTSFSGNVEVGLFGSGAASGTLFLDGSKTGSGTNLTASGATFGAVGTLMISIDDDAIMSASNMRAIDTVNTTFQSGSILDLGFGVGVTPTEGTWTILTADVNITDEGLVLAAGDAAAGWSFEIINNPSGTDDVLTVTYTAVPEPSVLALLGGTATLFYSLRRRKSGRIND